MMRLFSGFAAGGLFGAGLLISQMTNPQKVLSFLDVFGTWDPSLALVMASALIVTLIGYRLVLRRKSPLFEGKFRLPTRTDIDVRLVGGAALFGAGWGLAGLCPGPALAGLSFGGWSLVGFVIAMLTTMAVTRKVGV